MKDTPETDAQIIWFGGWEDNRHVPANFARKLEIERDEAREQIKKLIYIGERAIDLADIDFENDKFGVVSELRAELQQIKEGAK
jgi:hypothetical protein